MLAALPSLLLAVPQCRDGWMNYTEGSVTKCVTTTYESHGIAMHQNDCPTVCASLARTWLDANDPTPQPLCVGSSAEVAWWHANSPRATIWMGLERDGPRMDQASDWEGAPWGPAASPVHINDQCIASHSSFYEQVLAHIPNTEGPDGEVIRSDVWSRNDPAFGPWTADQDTFTENCVFQITEAAGGDNPGGGPGWCAPPAPAAVPPSAAPPSAAPPSVAPPSAAPRRAAPPAPG